MFGSRLVIDSHVNPAYGSAVNHSTTTLHAYECLLVSSLVFRTIKRSCDRRLCFAPARGSLRLPRSSRSASLPVAHAEHRWSTCSFLATVSPALATPLLTDKRSFLFSRASRYLRHSHVFVMTRVPIIHASSRSR